MDFELTDTQREYRDRARTLAEKRLLPGYADRERPGGSSRSCARRSAGSG
jgi:alkylation response protein AidB-like acyl-CoA dehydrogenase